MSGNRAVGQGAAGEPLHGVRLLVGQPEKCGDPGSNQSRLHVSIITNPGLGESCMGQGALEVLPGSGIDPPDY